MSDVFVDTSAIYALLVEEDDNHEDARMAAESLGKLGATLVTSSFVLLETVALLQTRVGIGAVRVFYLDVLPLLRIIWVDEDLLHRAINALLAASRRQVSLTDWASITLMQDHRIDQAFAFDEDFTRMGIDLIPTGST